MYTDNKVGEASLEAVCAGHLPVLLFLGKNENSCGCNKRLGKTILN
jgi:hypothetical protein